MAQPSGFIHLFMPDQTQRCMLQLLLQQNAPMNNKSQHKEVSPAARMTLKSLIKVSLCIFRGFFFKAGTFKRFCSAGLNISDGIYSPRV